MDRNLFMNLFQFILSVLFSRFCFITFCKILIQRAITDRKRVTKTSRKQYEIYVQFLEENEPFALGKYDSTANQNYFIEKWTELTDLLNTPGYGPVRSRQCWRTLLCGWRNQVKSKARKIQSKGLSNLNGEFCGGFVLSDIEQRALRAWKWENKEEHSIQISQASNTVPIKRDMDSSSICSIDATGNESYDGLTIPPRLPNQIEQAAVVLTMPMEYENITEPIAVNELDYTDDLNNMTNMLINATNTNTKILKEVHTATSSALEAVAASVNKVGEALLALAQAQQLAHSNEKLRLEFALAKIKLEIAQLNK